METLYRHFDNNGVLLYVGISCNHEARLKAHKKTSKWFASVCRIEIEQYETREEVYDAEKKAIQSESPLHNIIYNKHGRLCKEEPEDCYEDENATYIIEGVMDWAKSTNDISFTDYLATLGFFPKPSP